jgi:N-acetyl-1-D-myo-inositol-2-amino-2-deoxy-alpha-D-glucopyranoside deacetylase
MTRPGPDEEYPPAVIDDALIDVVVDASAYVERKRAALRRHVTQVRVEGDWYALSNGVGHALSGVEAYQRAGHRRPAGAPPRGDLFG